MPKDGTTYLRIHRGIVTVSVSLHVGMTKDPLPCRAASVCRALVYNYKETQCDDENKGLM